MARLVVLAAWRQQGALLLSWVWTHLQADTWCFSLEPSIRAASSAEGALDRLCGRPNRIAEESDRWYFWRFFSAGKVEARDIGSTSLDILVQDSQREGSVRLTLVYAVHVSKRAEDWTFYIDADTGQFVALHQHFDT